MAEADMLLKVSEAMGDVQGKRYLALLSIPKDKTRNGKKGVELVALASGRCQIPESRMTGDNALTCRALRAQGKRALSNVSKDDPEVLAVDVLNARGKFRTVPEQTVLTTLRESQLFYEGQANVKQLYRWRVNRLQATAARIQDYLGNLKRELSEAADRETVSTL